MGIGKESETAFAFEGKWQDYAPIAFTNALLNFVTLGFYRFWATTRERNYLWSQTRFVDDRLEWTGTGKELFFGFVIAIAAFLALSLPLRLSLPRSPQCLAPWAQLGLFLLIWHSSCSLASPHFARQNTG